LDKIEHIVVLMMENRSFDHMLGYLKLKRGLAIDGLNGTEQNPDLDGRRISVNPLASTLFPTDLGHSSADVREHLEDGNQGFVRNYLHQQNHAAGTLVMGYHDEAHVWAYDRLVTGYAVCDRWFSALPGPTIPNRLFAIAGQSGGDTDQPPHGVKIYKGVRTVFDCLDASLAGIPKKDRWGYYFHDLPMLSLLEQHITELLPLGPHRISKIGNFFQRAKTGTLPAVSWIDPNFQDIGSSNDDHPPKSDLYDGQLLVKSIYDAVVGGGRSLFSKTLLIVTYDEHGGFFDHVSPSASGDSPPFDRFGVRVPALLISPWIPAGTIDSVERSHASILRTILNRFAPRERLTARVDRAPDLSSLLSLSTARTTAIAVTAPARPPALPTRAFLGPSGSEVFFAAYRAELQRRGAVLDGAAPSARPALATHATGRTKTAVPRTRALSSADLTRPIRVLAVHGVGNQDQNPAAWQPQWTQAFRMGIARWTHRPVEVEFLGYDDIFAADEITPDEVKAALVKLAWNGLAAVVSDIFGRSRGLAEAPDLVRWTAGMVVQWIENDDLREKTRQRVLARFGDGQRWDIVAAHSLGSLICYDAFRSRDGRNAVRNSIFLSFGSQLGNMFVRGGFGGKIEPLNAAFWYHVFNPHDPVFTHSLEVFGGRFRQIVLDLSLPGILDEHDALAYLGAQSVVSSVFHDVAQDGAPAVSRGFPTVSRAPLSKYPERRALLIGINDYPDPANRLEGCVNDVYLVSSVLQELGFPADDIRVLMNDRATTVGIKERIEWLLEGSQDGNQRVLFYSGHGAQIPDYNAAEEVDHSDECLVPYDFDWTADRSITDKWFAALYGQLPYKAQFVSLFDCCHSGGMTRAGAARVRGLTPPDDIRHRALEWDSDLRVWKPRKPKPWNEQICLPPRMARDGVHAGKRRLGSASDARIVSSKDKRYRSLRQDFNNKGPYMPILLEACHEDELAYEYREGTTSYGAFTFFLAQTVRSHVLRKEPLTFQALVADAAEGVRALYAQTPQLECPDVKRRESILGPGTRRTTSKTPVRRRNAGRSRVRRRQS